MAATGLSIFEREQIKSGLDRHESYQTIAERISKHRTTVGREVKRNGGRNSYSPALAARNARRQRRRPKELKCLIDKDLGQQIASKLKSGLSPAAIVALAKRNNEPYLAVETIYKSAYCLALPDIKSQDVFRTRRKRRRRHNSLIQLGPLSKATIQNRPVEAANRSELGHWEGDVVCGARNQSGVLTLVDRKARYLHLVRAESCSSSIDVRNALIAYFQDRIPPRLRKTLTWDGGSELAQWQDIERALKLPIFICNPRSPWERPSNENTNRHLRFWLPKGTDLSIYTQRQLNAIAKTWNHQPRRLFNWKSSAEIYNEVSVH